MNPTRQRRPFFNSKVLLLLVATGFLLSLAQCPAAEMCCSDILLIKKGERDNASDRKILENQDQIPDTLRDNRSSIVFDPVRWRHDRFDPCNGQNQMRMIEDLLETHRLTGMSRESLYSLLGLPDENFESYARYRVSYQPRWIFFSETLPSPALDFAFCDNHVAKYRVVDYRRKDDWTASQANQKNTPRVEAESSEFTLLKSAKEQESKHDLPGMISSYKAILEMFPKDVIFWDKLSLAQIQDHQPKEALYSVAQSKIFGMDSNRWIRDEVELSAYIQLEQFQKAIAQLIDKLDSKGLSLDSRNILHLQRGAVYAKMNNKKLALEDLALVQDSRYQYYRARLYIHLGEYRLAVSDLTEIIRLTTKYEEELKKDFLARQYVSTQGPPATKQFLELRSIAFEHLGMRNEAERDRMEARNSAPVVAGRCMTAENRILEMLLVSNGSKQQANLSSILEQ